MRGAELVRRNLESWISDRNCGSLESLTIMARTRRRHQLTMPTTFLGPIGDAAD